MTQPEVDRYIAGLSEPWQRAGCERLAADLRGAAPFGEHLKWGHPYFELNEAAVIKWFCAKQWINVYFFRGRELPDPRRLFQDSNNARMLTVRVSEFTELDREAFRGLVGAAVALAAGRACSTARQGAGPGSS